MSKFRKIYIIAGEASGDLLGAHLMRALAAQSSVPVKFFGVGGEKMTAEGLTTLFPYHELSLMGFVEILPYLFTLAMRINTTVEDILAKEPDVVITIDSPGFCFRIVEKLRKHKAKTKFIHYVAPTVWAYKPERAKKCAALFDHMLVLLPFEPPYFEKVGLPCTWVGHAAVVETKVGNGKNFREKYDIPEDTPLFCLLPGSRKGEVIRHMPIFGQAISMLATQFPNLVIAVTVPKNVMPFVAPYFENRPFRAIVTSSEQDKKDAIAASNIAIVKSGTVALEVAAAATPMIVAYRINPLSAWAFRRMSKQKYANIINILQEKEVIPELLQENCTPLLIASAGANLLSDRRQQHQQQEQSKAALSRLFPPDGQQPSHIAARIILEIM